MTESNIKEFGTTEYGADPEQALLDWYYEKAHRESAENTRDRVERPVNDFKSFLSQHDLEPSDVTIDDAYIWMKGLTKKLGASEQRSRAMWISDFYNFCNKRGHSKVTGNPISLAKEENTNLLDTPQDRDPHIIDVGEMSEYICSFEHPLWIAVTTLLAKTTVRKGPIHNLDLYDINIDHPACDWEVHKDLRHQPNYIYIPREPEKGKEFRGEVRGASNKSKVDRIIPIDNELRDALLWWLLVRPGDQDPHSPLFKTNFPTNSIEYGDRLPYGRIDKKITKRSKMLGHWYDAYDDDNINPHYFRHWSTTTLEERLSANTSIVDILRGDKGNSTRDRYTHWTKEKENRYLNIVPKFFSDEVQSEQ